MNNSEKNTVESGTASEVFQTFLKLGLTSFGGPVAHLGYFRRELVEKRKWLSDDQFGQLLAICQFLPGPASSQLGFSLGLLRGGWLGALAAFIGFTLPSALLLIAFATVLPILSHPAGQAAIHGLKLVACAVVADAILGMSKTLCPDASRKVIGILAASILLFAPSSWMQLVVVAVAGLGGSIFLRLDPGEENTKPLPLTFTPRTGGIFLLVFAGLLFGLPPLAAVTGGLPTIAEAFYRAGALVFGGGHVVLPLLQDLVVTTGMGDARSIPGRVRSLPGDPRADVCLFRLSGHLDGTGCAIPSYGDNCPGLHLSSRFSPRCRCTPILACSLPQPCSTESHSRGQRGGRRPPGCSTL